MIYKTLSFSLLLSSAFLICADDITASSDIQEVAVQATVDTEVSMEEITEEQVRFDLPSDQKFRSYYDSLSPEQQQEYVKDYVKFGEELMTALAKPVEKLQDLIGRCEALRKTRSATSKGGTIKIQIMSKSESSLLSAAAQIDAVVNDPMNDDLTADAKSEFKGLLEQTIEICKNAEKDVQEVILDHPTFKSQYTDGLCVSLLVSSPTNVYVLKA